MTTPSTTTFSRGDVVIVPFQFSDRPVFKNRPAVVVSADAFQAKRQDVIIAAVTSRLREPLLSGDCQIAEWREAGLPKPSVATAILRTVKDAMIVRRMGALTREDMRSLDSNLAFALGLSP